MQDFRKEYSKYRHRIRIKKHEKKQKTEDIVKFHKEANERKRKHDDKLKTKDKEAFRQNINERKRKQEEKQRITDKDKFRKNANERERKHEEKRKAEDKEGFRKDANKRKRKLEAQQKNQDPKKFKENVCQRRRKSDSNISADKRIGSFRKRVQYGPIFVCSSCHQKLFSQQVEKLTKTLKDTIDEVDRDIRNACIDDEILVDLGRDKDGNHDKCAYICKSCKKYLLKGKLPKLCIYNGLEIDSLGTPEIKLTELENNLIARNIIFQKIHKLPKSRWSGTHDRLVNVPVGPQDVLNTIESLPRTPAEAGIIPILPVKLKRKLEYKTTHLIQLIDTDRIFKYLEYLCKMGHPSYKFYDDWNVYKQRCKVEDPSGCYLIFIYGKENIIRNLTGLINI